MGIFGARGSSGMSPRDRRALQRAAVASKFLSAAVPTDSVASATTVNLNYTTGELVEITGTTTIEGFAEANDVGEWRFVIFADALFLVNDLTSFILPGGVEIKTAAGDTAEFYHLGSGNWKCVRYTRGGMPPSSDYNTHYANYCASAALPAYTFNSPFGGSPGNAQAGETITFNAVGSQSVDGSATLASDLILVAGEATQERNGIYKVTTKGTGAIAEVWTRHNGMDNTGKMTGAVVYINDGNTWVWSLWGHYESVGFVNLNSIESSFQANVSRLTASDLAITDVVPYADLSESGDNTNRKATVSRFLGFTSTSLCEGRLSLTSGLDVTTADVTGATNVYFTPCTGDRITIYDGTRLCLYVFTERTLALGALTSGLPYDVFIYDNAGTLTLESLAWTNGTTRATALVRQNGAYYKTGALTRRYLGTFYTTSTTQTEDSEAKRFLFNAHNRRWRNMKVVEGTDSWTYSTAAYRQANNAAANQLAFVRGLQEDIVRCDAYSIVINSTATARAVRTGIGLDSTTVNSATVYDDKSITSASYERGYLRAAYVGHPGLGYHYLAWLEYGAGADTQTWSGDAGGIRQTGIIGEIWA